jgi:curved DNA-binding protein CbpA
LFLFGEVKNHYETLGIPRTAGDTEIKRAYFGLVRKYQPDRSPDEFKEIRAAYETLSDREKRAEYDAIGELPSSVAPMFYEAQRLDRLGRGNQAAEYYQAILRRHPKLDNVREQYARSLSMNDKTGKAAEAWEELCRRHPDNPHYSRELAQSYCDRSWQKKALAEIQRALTLDRSSIDGWIQLISYIIMNRKSDPNLMDKLEDVSREALEAVKAVKTNEWKKICIYTHLFLSAGIKKADTARDCLREMIRLVRENGRDGREECKESIREILRILSCESLADFYPEFKEMADLLSDMKTTFIREKIDTIRLGFEINNLEKKGFHEIFGDLFRILNADFEEDSDEVEVLSIEYYLLNDKKSFDPQIRRLKDEFPELYALHRLFFDETLRSRDPDRMLYQRAKKVRRLKRQFGANDDDTENEDFDQPVRRAEPKVGRNDPCPCGSGKKYKRCCGR